MSRCEATTHFDIYKSLIEQLAVIIRETHQRATADEPDPLFSANMNFYTKAYLISLCTYLEAFLQDACLAFVNSINERLKEAKIPNNILKWDIKGELKSKDSSYNSFLLSVDRQKISQIISGNPYKTIKFFEYVGLDLRKNNTFNEHKDEVARVVDKRNSIVHRNDSASDISLLDIINYSNLFIEYMECIKNVLRLKIQV